MVSSFTDELRNEILPDLWAAIKHPIGFTIVAVMATPFARHFDFEHSVTAWALVSTTYLMVWSWRKAKWHVARTIEAALVGGDDDDAT